MLEGLPSFVQPVTTQIETLREVKRKGCPCESPPFGQRPYREEFGTFAWWIPILVTISKTVLRHSNYSKVLKYNCEKILFELEGEASEPERRIAWTTEEEIALAKGWVAISENIEHGNARKKNGFWCEVLAYIESKTKAYGCRTYDMVCEKWKTVQRAMIHYQAETGLSFKFRQCWDVLKDSPKWKEIALPNFNIGSEGGSKRHKSSGSSSFNTKSGDASINLNTNVVDEDEVQEI
ncbi:hypothetical protein Tco_1386411 [Tanacetum coccineum]